jgi:hypothetical protein
VILFCLVVAWMIVRAWDQARAQAGAEYRRARAEIARELGRRLDAGWASGPGASGWWWPAAGFRAWRAMRGPRSGSARAAALPGSTPLRRIMQAAWTGGVRGGTEGSDRARQRRAAHRAARAAGTTRTRRAARTAAAGAGDAAGRWWPWQAGPSAVVRMRACDDCGALCADTALQLAPREIDGHTEFWLLCADCRASSGTGQPSADADSTEAGDIPGTTVPELPAAARDSGPVSAIPDGQEAVGPEGFIVTFRSRSGRIIDPRARSDTTTIAVWTREDLDRRLALAAADPDYEVTVAKAPATEELAAAAASEETEELEEPTMPTGTVPAVTAGGGESYTHGAWNQATAGIHHRLTAGLPQALEVMLASLTSADAGRTQVTGVMGLADAVESWAAQVRDMLTQVNVRELPVTEAFTAAGGPDEVAGIPYLSEV